MSNPKEEKPVDDFLLTFADFRQILKKNKSIIKLGAATFALLGLFYGLTKPIMFEAEGTFKEKSKSQSGLSNSLSSALFMINEGGDSNAMTIMRSKSLLKDLIKDQDLQGLIVKEERRFPLIPFQTIKDNIVLEYKLFKNVRSPILVDAEKPLSLQNIHYNNEIDKVLQLKTVSSEKYIIVDLSDQSETIGYFDQPFFKENYSFVVSQKPSSRSFEGSYLIVLQPLNSLAKQLENQFKIEPDKIDKSLLRITFQHPDRKIAANNVNALMTIYQNHIQTEHEKISEKQISYLLQRQKEMANVLEEMIQEYATELSSDLSSTGFATSEKALDYLADTQSQLKQKLFNTNLDIQRLEKAKTDSSAYQDVFFGLGHMDAINRIAAEMRLLKQQGDSLNLALRNTPAQSQEFKDSFASQLKNLDEIKQSIKESNHAIASLNKGIVPREYPNLADESKYIFNNWRDRLVAAKDTMDQNPTSKECLKDWLECKSGFTSYLSHLNHFLNVYQRNIEERLSHQQAPLKEFQGINLNMAGDLYISYNKDLSHVESQKNQHEFILNQLNEPDFEISSLSTLLNDALSLDMITKTSGLILALKDQDNRSTKEQDRLNFDLAIQKGFLKTHIEQSIALLGLRQEFLKEKIQRLQSLNLSLIQEKISILENELNEYISGSLENLNQEQLLIEQNLAELRIEMSTFPQKWAAEELINQQMDINKSLVEEISKLVESKNISNNLEKLQSAPLDMAYAPLHPKPPRLILLAIIGAILGVFLSFLVVLGKSVIEGIQVSKENLKAAGQFVCGSFSRKYKTSFDQDPLLDEDLATLRRLNAFIDPLKQPHDSKHNSLLLIEGKGPHYASALAELLSHKGLKTLVLELRFDETSDSQSPGLLQYLEGKVEKPEIQHFKKFDKIASGGICRYANELICSKRFQELLRTYSSQYDWVVVSTSAIPKSAEAESLMDMFSNAVITVTNEKLHDLKNCMQHANQSKNHVAFIIASSQ